jgi:putative methyltransferase (TIGR04325 family)
MSTGLGWDLYLRLAASRLTRSYRGLYGSYSEALEASKENERHDYDAMNEVRSKDTAKEHARLEKWFHDHDYPALYWLSQVLNQHHRVLEFGGSIGQFYYSIKRYLEMPENLQWTILELPAAAKLGALLASERNEQSLRFMESGDWQGVPECEIFFSSGTLQYVETRVAELIGKLPNKPLHVILHHSPLTEDIEYWTLQRLKLCELPYKIASHTQLLGDMDALDYDLIAHWKDKRQLEIPFHRDVQLEGYSGYYFRLKT